MCFLLLGFRDQHELRMLVRPAPVKGTHESYPAPPAVPQHSQQSSFRDLAPPNGALRCRHCLILVFVSDLDNQHWTVSNRLDGFLKRDKTVLLFNSVFDSGRVGVWCQVDMVGSEWQLRS